MSSTVATLTVELEDLRNSICHSCKNKLASSNPSVPQILVSADQGSTGPGTATSVSAPLWRRVFQGGRQHSRPRIDNTPSIRPSHLQAASPNTNKPLPVPSEPEVGYTLSSSQTTPAPIHLVPNEDINSLKRQSAPPEWLVVYNPEVERALELQLAHAFTYDTPVFGLKMSPDGQRVAVGLKDDGKTYLYELKTGSNVWLVLAPHVQDLN